jgi:phosphoserine phosphatase
MAIARTEVTQEMIEAGVNAHAGYNPEYENIEDRIINIYIAMEAARNIAIKQYEPISLHDLYAIRDKLDEITIPPEILEAAEDLVSRSDVIGIEHGPLETLLRVVLFLDRRQRKV